MNKKLSLLLAGAAAYFYYRYTKMTDAQRQDLINGLKDKGNKLYEQYVSSDLKDKFSKFS